MNVPPENYISKYLLYLNLIMVRSNYGNYSKVLLQIIRISREDITILLKNCNVLLTCAYNT